MSRLVIKGYPVRIERYHLVGNLYFENKVFIDEEGIEAMGKDVVIKGFANGYRIGCLMWNRHYSVSVPGYGLINSSESGRENANNFSPLDSKSLRLLILEK